MARVQSEDSQQRRGEVEGGRGGRNAAEVAAVTRRCFASCVGSRVRMCSRLCVPVWVHPVSQMLSGGCALFSWISISFYHFVFNLLTSVLQQRAVNLISFFALISEWLCNKYPNSTLVQIIIPALMTEVMLWIDTTKRREIQTPTPPNVHDLLSFWLKIDCLQLIPCLCASWVWFKVSESSLIGPNVVFFFFSPLKQLPPSLACLFCI